MSPAEFQSLRERHGWSRGTLKRILGLRANSLIADWEDGKRFIPGYIALLMHCLDQCADCRALALTQAQLKPPGRPKKITIE